MARLLFGAFGMSVGLFIALAVGSLIMVGGEKADRLIGDYGLLIFCLLYVISIAIVSKKLSR